MLVPRTCRYVLSFLLLLCLVFSATGCSLMADLQDVMAFRTALVDEYGEQNVNVTISGAMLMISFVNSPFNDLSAEDQESRAREIATFTLSNYPSIDSVNKIVVIFAVQEKRGVVTYTDNTAAFTFLKSELQP